MELVPRVRLLLDNFSKSRYTDVLAYLEQSKVRPQLEGDAGIKGGMERGRTGVRKEEGGLFRTFAAFYGSSYVPALIPLWTPFSSCTHQQPDALLDIYLRTHVTGLYDEIQKRSLIQYVAPYQSVDLHQMAAAFNMPLPKVRRPASPPCPHALNAPHLAEPLPVHSLFVPARHACSPQLEATLIQLILAESIKARIDSQHKVLLARQSDARSATLDRTLKTGREFTRQSKAALLRINMLRADFVVRRAEGQGDRGGAGSDTTMMAVDDRAGTPV